MPKLPTPSNPNRSKEPTFNEAHLVMVLTHETVVKPDQMCAARERLLALAAEQPVLAPLSPPQTFAARCWSHLRAFWTGLTAPLRDHVAYERMRLPMGMMHHYNFDRYYTYKLISLAA